MHTPSNLTHTASDLLSYEPFIRSIARSLISNEDQIGDIVQETWLRALKKPPREAGSIKSWLGRVTRNLALDQRRREGTRKTREVAAARDESVLDDEKDLALHSKIVEGVLGLEEPYKSVVILHYYRGMKLAEVARKLERNAATVRSQLKRAHEMLRGKLDSDYGGDRATWMALCVPLAGKKAGVGATGVAVKAAIVLIVAAAVVAGSRAWMESSDVDGEGSKAVLARPDGGEQANSESDVAGLQPVTGERTSLATGDRVFVTIEGEPVEGADVWSLEVSRVTREVLEEDPDLALDGERIFDKLGTHSVTDASGYAQLTRPSGDFAIMVAKGSHLSAITPEESKPTLIEVELERVASVSARAVDGSSQIVTGVPVVLSASVFDPVRNKNSGPEEYELMTRLTDSETGVAFFRAFEKVLTSEAKPEWSLRLNVPGLPNRKTNFSLERDAEAPLELRVADTGSLVVRAFDVSGDPILSPGTVAVYGVSNPGHSLTARLENGSAHFPFVGVGAELGVVLAIPELGANWKRECVGPPNPGLTKTFDIRRPAGASLKGLALSESGEPLANAKVRLSVLDENLNSIHHAEIKTDANGGIVAEVEPLFIGSSVRVTFAHYGVGVAVAVAELEQFIQLSADVTDLGEIRLLNYRRDIQGRCVNSAGDPLPGIELSAEQIAGFGGSGATTNERGEFRLPGIFSEGVTVSTERATKWMLSRPFTVPSDSETIELILTRAGSIEGAVQLEEGIDASRVIVVAYDESQTSPTGTSWSAFTYCDAETGRFVANGLGSGSYRLQFSLDGAKLRAFEGVVVTESQPSSDPRVELVDLLESTESVQFRVVDAGGKPIRVGSAVAYALAGGQRVGLAINEADGTISMLFKSSPDATIYVSSAGSRGVFLEVEDATGDIVLEPGISVRLRTLERLTTSRGADTYSFSLRRIEEDPRYAGLDRTVSVPAALMRDGTATVRFPAPGRYELCYSRHSDAGSDGLMMASAETVVPTPIEEEFVVEVPESASTVTLDITLPDKLPE